MPDHFRSLIAIAVLANMVFALLRYATVPTIATDDFRRRRNVWLALTLVAFLAHDFWVAMVGAAVVLHLARTREANPVALWCFVLMSIPPLAAPIPGLVIARLFDIDFSRMLSLVLLLPAAIALYQDPQTSRPGSTGSDKLLLAFVGWVLFLIFLASSFTNLLRSIVVNMMDVLVPYYVASRALRQPDAVRDALACFVAGATVMACIGMFEYARGWVLYASLIDALGVDNGLLRTLTREDAQRATGSTGQPIPLGYVLALAIGFWLHLQTQLPRLTLRVLTLLALAGGLYATISRGPWLGAAAIVLTYVLSGPKPLSAMLRLTLASVVACGALLLLPGGKQVIDLLPWIGSNESETFSYRQQLIDYFVPIILDNPIFGASAYLYGPEIEALRTGGGIIDLVNTYISIGLYNGLVGVVLFVGFFLSVAAGVWKRSRRCADPADRDLGRAILAALVGILLIIGTVSSISVIPYIYWLVAGIGAAYALQASDQPAARPLPAHRRALAFGKATDEATPTLTAFAALEGATVRSGRPGGAY